MILFSSFPEGKLHEGWEPFGKHPEGINMKQEAREGGGGWRDITAFSGTYEQTEYFSALAFAPPCPFLSTFSSDFVPPEMLIHAFSGQLLNWREFSTELFLLSSTSPHLGRELRGKSLCLPFALFRLR